MDFSNCEMSRTQTPRSKEQLRKISSNEFGNPEEVAAISIGSNVYYIACRHPLISRPIFYLYDLNVNSFIFNNKLILEQTVIFTQQEAINSHIRADRQVIQNLTSYAQLEANTIYFTAFYQTRQQLAVPAHRCIYRTQTLSQIMQKYPQYLDIYLLVVTDLAPLIEQNPDATGQATTYSLSKLQLKKERMLVANNLRQPFRRRQSERLEFYILDTSYEEGK